MSAGAKKRGLPDFLGEKHLLAWLTGSADGLKLLGHAARKWLEETKEGAELVRREIEQAQHAKPKVLVVLWGNGEVEVWADANSRIRIANVDGHPSMKDLGPADVGHDHAELCYWPNPPEPIKRAAGRMMSDTEIRATKQAADMWVELQKKLKP